MSQIVLEEICEPDNNMSQSPIGQRIKFLIESENISIRGFARELDLSDTHIRNYLTKGTKPSSDVLERIVQRFPRINSLWLLTGDGQPFHSDPLTQANENNATDATTKNFSENQIATGKQQAQQQGKRPQVFISNSANDLRALQQQLELANKEMEGLRAVIAAKDETIQLLKATTQKQPSA